jgi:hypothetical protein
MFWAFISLLPWGFGFLALIVVGALLGGFTSIAKIITIFWEIVAAIADYWREDRARKIIAAAIFFILGAFLGDWHGTYEERKKWKAEEAIMSARIKSLAQDNADLRKLGEAQEKQRQPVFEREIKIDDKHFETQTKPQCPADGFTGDDLERLRKYRREPVQRKPR